MSYRVRLTETAKQDLREIAFYIADQAKDKEVARNFVNELRASCNRLTDFPQAGALPKDHVLRSISYSKDVVRCSVSTDYRTGPVHSAK